MHQQKGQTVLRMRDILEGFKAHAWMKKMLPTMQRDLTRAKSVRASLRRSLRRFFEWGSFERLVALSEEIRVTSHCIETFMKIDGKGTDPRTGTWWPACLR